MLLAVDPRLQAQLRIAEIDGILERLHVELVEEQHPVVKTIHITTGLRRERASLQQWLSER